MKIKKHYNSNFRIILGPFSQNWKTEILPQILLQKFLAIMTLQLHVKNHIKKRKKLLIRKISKRKADHENGKNGIIGPPVEEGWKTCCFRVQLFSLLLSFLYNVINIQNFKIEYFSFTMFLVHSVTVVHSGVEMILSYFSMFSFDSTIHEMSCPKSMHRTP